MRPYQIFRSCIHWNGCPDPRPWLIYEIRPNNVFACFPISSHCYGANGSEVLVSEPEFHLTGLTKNCFILYEKTFELTAAQLLNEHGKHQLKGEITGTILARFREAAGV